MNKLVFHEINSGKQRLLLAQVLSAFRVRHYSLKTEHAYIHSIKDSIYFHK